MEEHTYVLLSIADIKFLMFVPNEDSNGVPGRRYFITSTQAGHRVTLAVIPSTYPHFHPYRPR